VPYLACRRGKRGIPKKNIQIEIMKKGGARRKTPVQEPHRPGAAGKASVVSGGPFNVTKGWYSRPVLVHAVEVNVLDQVTWFCAPKDAGRRRTLPSRRLQSRNALPCLPGVGVPRRPSALCVRLLSLPIRRGDRFISGPAELSRASDLLKRRGLVPAPIWVGHERPKKTPLALAKKFYDECYNRQPI